MAKGKNYRQLILGAVDEANGWDKEIYLDALAMGTGIEPHKISTSIATMRKDGWPITVARREGRKIVAWVFQDRAKWTDKVVAGAKAKGEAFKEEGRAQAFKQGYTAEDMERGRRVIVNFERLPLEVKNKIDALKKVLPNQERGELEKVLVELLGAKPVQDSDPSFWAVDQFADGSLMLARKDGTHWKATKL